MRNKTIFRITSALLVLLILVCGFSLNAYASDGGEYSEIVTSEIANETPIITVPEQNENDKPISEKQPNAFTPDGNMTLVDNIEGENDGQKQFIIVKSKNGHYFYIIIDHAADGENTVHFLNQVDEADLMEILAEDGKTIAPAECVCTDKCTVGNINTACPVCKVTMTDCKGAEDAPSDKTEPPADDNEKPASGLSTGTIIGIIVAAVLAGGGLFYYFKVLKPKKQGNKTAQGAELSELEYDEYDEDEEYTEALEEIADEMNRENDDTEDGTET